MAQGTLSIGVAIGGLSIQRSIVRTADSASSVEISLPVGYAGSLTTRTDAETGTVTASGHGILSASVVDIFWDGGARYGVTVGTVTSSTIPIGADNSGTGDDLPSSSTAVVVSPQVAFNVAIDGDELVLIGIEQNYTSTTETAISHVSLLDSGDAEILGLALNPNSPRTWDITGGDTNDFTGNPITNGVASNGSATNAATLKINYLQDATP